MRQLTVKSQESGQRLDKYLAKYLNLAGKNFLYKMMRKKNITLNGKKCDGSEKIEDGDCVKLFLSEDTIEKFSEIKIQKVKTTKLHTIYEDEHILLINKPVGMLSQKARDTDESLVEYLIDYLLNSGQMTVEDLKSFRPSVCNRLDRNTSGLVAAGKTIAGLQIMGEILKNRSVHKYYLCVVTGKLQTGQKISGFLRKDARTNQVFIGSRQEEGSIPIQTEYEPLSCKSAYTLLKVKLITGRSHQIRAHLASIGHPIVGDSKYGRKQGNEAARREYGITSQLLHSYQIEFPDLPDPLAHLSGQRFTASLPDAFRRMTKGEDLWVPGIQED